MTDILDLEMNRDLFIFLFLIRQLAKSTLILIPIFGLHFIFFAWLPYARIVADLSKIEIPIVYIETFFDAFQVSELFLNLKEFQLGYFNFELKIN